VLAGQKNVCVLLENVTGVDLANKKLATEAGDELEYDYLILALGAKTDYFGHADWEAHAPGLKSLGDATEIRRRVLLAYELAEREKDDAKRRHLLTFVVIGGGPTGVELAGALAELARHVLASDFRRIHPEEAKVLLLEGGERILPSFEPKLSAAAVRQLEELGVEVRTNTRVSGIDADGVHIGETHLMAANVLWAAGVRSTRLNEALGVPLDRAGRVIVEKDCTVPGHDNVFAIGDMAAFLDREGKALPGVSPVAMQQARFVAKAIKNAVAGSKEPRGTFEYYDKGTMATIGRSRAIAEAGKLRMTGFMAWLAWLFVHLFYLIGHRNRVAVLLTWFWSYVTYKRGARLIIGRVDKI
jgi:NADH dehydrogenase